MGQSTTPRQRALFVVFLLALFPAGNALNPGLDEDTWWHLAVGKHVVEQRGVPGVDPFSRISREQAIPWVAYSWLHEVALFGAYKLGGFTGLLLFRHILDSLTFLTSAWFILRRAGGGALGLVVLALMTATLVPMMLERPWHYTIVLTVLTLHATLEWRAGTPAWRFWWLLPAYAVWANLHIQFVLGFGVLGLGWGCAVIERLLHRHERDLRSWFLVMLGCVVATLCNPYHARLYVVVWEYATQTGALRVVSELAPPDFGLWWNWALVALLLWAGYAGVRARLPLFETALLIVGAIFSLRMQRDIWFGALTAATMITLRRPASPIAIPFRGLVVATVSALVLTRVVWHIGPGAELGAERTNRDRYPAAAVEYLRAQRPPGPLFNHFNWGGYLIWSLPEYPVGMDGRTNLYGEERLQRSFRTWLAEDWQSDPELLAAGVVLAPARFGRNDVPLTEALRRAPERWAIAYEDEVAVIFVPVK